jgi:hypothetical protein
VRGVKMFAKLRTVLGLGGATDAQVSDGAAPPAAAAEVTAKRVEVPAAPMLTDEHLKNCRVVADRTALLGHLPLRLGGLGVDPTVRPAAAPRVREQPADDDDSVHKDLSVAGHKVVPGGILVMNDYVMYDPFLGAPYGVIHATNEFCLEHGWELVYLALQQHMFNDVALRKL